MWPAIIGAVGGFVGNALTKDYNNTLIKRQQQYNTSEREASQQFQNQQRESQNQFAEDMYNKYQSPQALAYQYSRAGLNPRLAMKDGGAGSVQASSGSSGGAPSGAMPTMPYMQSPDFTQGFVNMANVLKSLAEAKQAGVQTSQMEQVFSTHMRSEVAAAEAQEIANRYSMKYGDMEHFVSIAKTLSDARVGEAQAANLWKEYHRLCVKYNMEKNDEQLYWKRWGNEQRAADDAHNVALSEIHANMAKGDRDRGGINLDAATAFNQQQQGNLNMVQAAVYKLAGLGLMQADSRLKNSIASLNELEYEVRSATSEEEKQAARDKFERVAQQIDSEIGYLISQAEKAKKEGDMLLLGKCIEGLSAIGGLVIGYGMYRNAKVANSLKQASRYAPSLDLGKIDLSASKDDLYMETYGKHFGRIY